MVEYFRRSDGIFFLVTLPFVKRLIVSVHLKAVRLLILLNFFAKVSDPHPFCYDF